MLGAPLLFAIELTILYAAGYYAMGRLMRISGFGGGGSVLGRMAFYLLVFPGVVLHEGAHYLACLLTGTRVSRFAPFSPGRRSNGGRLMLGYVRHERRAFPIGAIIGLAPILLNPLGLLFVTAFFTPLTFREVATPTVGVVVEGIFASGFLTDTPLLAAIWAYLSLSFALGSVPSREDLSGLPMVLLVIGGRRDSPGCASQNGLRECSLLSDRRAVHASGGTLRPAGHGRRRRCADDGAWGRTIRH
jgi:hypothetical protein